MDDNGMGDRPGDICGLHYCKKISQEEEGKEVDPVNPIIRRNKG